MKHKSRSKTFIYPIRSQHFSIRREITRDCKNQSYFERIMTNFVSGSVMLLSSGPWGKNSVKYSSKFSFTKMNLKTLSAKWKRFCSGGICINRVWVLYIFGTVTCVLSMVHSKTCVSTLSVPFRYSSSQFTVPVLYTIDISRCNITRYFIQHNNFEGKTSTRLQTLERRPYLTLTGQWRRDIGIAVHLLSCPMQPSSVLAITCINIATVARSKPIHHCNQQANYYSVPW